MSEEIYKKYVQGTIVQTARIVKVGDKYTFETSLLGSPYKGNVNMPSFDSRKKAEDWILSTNKWKKEKNTMEIEEKVWNNIKEYFRLQLPKYKVLKVRRKSVYEEDNYLYMVSAKKCDGTYAVWTCWNESTKCLNCGHYNLKSIKDCEKVFQEFYNG